MRTLAMPRTAEAWSLTSPCEKLIKNGAKVISHGRYFSFQIAEVAVSRQMFAAILTLIARLRAPPRQREGRGDQMRQANGTAEVCLDAGKAARFSDLEQKVVSAASRLYGLRITIATDARRGDPGSDQRESGECRFSFGLSEVRAPDRPTDQRETEPWAQNFGSPWLSGS
jgi:hypothetical protein